MTRELHWMDLLAVGMARWFLWACPEQRTNPAFWDLYEDAQRIYRAYCAYEDLLLKELGAMDIHMGRAQEYEP